MQPNQFLTTILGALAALSFAAQPASAEPPVSSDDIFLVPDFLTTDDGVLDEDDDLVFDADVCPDLGWDPNPVLAPDGHQLTWGELNQVQGSVSLKCDNAGTHVTFHLTGLIPKGVYTIWLLTFEFPGFDPDFTHFIGEGSLGAPDGSENSFVASAAGTASLSVHHPAGDLSEFGATTGCLFDEFEFHLVGAYHPDGQTYGPFPGPEEAGFPDLYCYFIEHFAFVFVP